VFTVTSLVLTDGEPAEPVSLNVVVVVQFNREVTRVAAMHINKLHEGKCIVYWYFLGAFAKLRKATVSFVASVRPSVRMQQLGSHWKDIHKL
jgi:hypothetical protein